MNKNMKGGIFVQVMEIATIGLVVVSVALVVVTWWYVRLTQKMLKEQHAMRVYEQEPLLVMRVLSDDNTHKLKLTLVVENVGRGVARAVKFETDENWAEVAGDLKGEYGDIKDGMRYLPPGISDRLEGNPLPIVEQMVRSASNKATVIKVTYEDSLDYRYCNNEEIKFREFELKKKSFHS